MIVKTKIKDHNIYLNKVALVKLSKRELTLLNLYAYYLEEANDIYRTSLSFKKKLCFLYDSSFQISIQALGEYVRIIYSFCYLDSRFLNDESYNNLNMFSFFEEISSRPLLVKDHFSKRLFNSCKKDYSDDLLSTLESPNYRAKVRFIDELLKNSDLILKDEGSAEDLKSIDILELEAFYNNKIKNLKFSYYTNYDLAPKEYKLSHNFNYELKKRIDIPSEDLYIPNDTNECYINIAVENNLFYGEENYLYGFVLNNLLGGGMNSLLFRIIREKYSLCYSIASKYNSTLGVFFVSLMTDSKNRVKAISLIKDIITSFSFTRAEFEIAKKALINAFISRDDYVFGFVVDASIKEYFNFYLSNEEKINLIAELNYEKALELAKEVKVKLSVSYGGKENE